MEEAQKELVPEDSASVMGDGHLRVTSYPRVRIENLKIVAKTLHQIPWGCSANCQAMEPTRSTIRRQVRGKRSPSEPHSCPTFCCV